MFLFIRDTSCDSIIYISFNQYRKESQVSLASNFFLVDAEVIAKLSLIECPLALGTLSYVKVAIEYFLETVSPAWNCNQESKTRLH